MNKDELAVYADELQIAGDPRGEIIALELAPPRQAGRGGEEELGGRRDDGG